MLNLLQPVGQAQNRAGKPKGKKHAVPRLKRTTVPQPYSLALRDGFKKDREHSFFGLAGALMTLRRFKWRWCLEATRGRLMAIPPPIGKKTNSTGQMCTPLITNGSMILRTIVRAYVRTFTDCQGNFAHKHIKQVPITNSLLYILFTWKERIKQAMYIG
jgi:hypothetical protein